MKPAGTNRIQGAALALLAATLAGAFALSTPAAQDVKESVPAAAAVPKAPAPSDSGPALREVADSFGFHIGSTMQPKILDNPLYRETLGREFNSFISFVFMKQVERAPGQFDFRGMDRDMEFARAHHQKLFGATHVYRAGVVAPDWLVPRHLGNFGHSKEEFDRYLKDYIGAVERHGGDTYFVWEVVGEPLSNPNQPWQAVFGRDEYIAKAFRYARAANPSALLELNETFGQGGIDRGKCDEFFDLVQRLKSQGVPIDVAGTEMHLEAQELRPTYLDELRYFLVRARATGVKAYISEMDVYQGPPGMFPDPMEHQRQIYHDVAATCLADSNCIGLTVFGVSDIRSWLQAKYRNPHPDAKPLLFDEQFHKKPAYFGVLSALQERAAATKGAADGR
ncbi:MAG TPA: endo-1,4-beta-xylanase [Terriglobia bacterium]|nr:endo-1,4-beta-xylanase [Terriglobia bacterium]